MMNKKMAQKVADKITKMFDLLKELTEEDIKYLKATKAKLNKDMGTLQAAAGILIPLNKADLKERLAKQAIDRIDGILLIWEAIDSRQEAVDEFVSKEQDQRNIESLFNL